MHLTALTEEFGSIHYQLGSQIGPIVEEVVLAQGSMARSLYSKPALLTSFIETNTLVNYILVATTIAMVTSAFTTDEVGKSVGRDRVGNNGAMRMLLEYHVSYKRYERITLPRL